MNWSHSGAVVRTVGFVWVAAAILVVTEASLEVWFACGIAGVSLGVLNSLQSDRHPRRSASRQFTPFPFRRKRLPGFRPNIVSDRFPPIEAAD